MKKTHADLLRFPPLNALVAFEAAARLGSLTLAADELFVTPGAASRRIKTLEHALGIELFRRRHNAIELTDSGRSFLRHVENALAQIQLGLRELAQSPRKLTIHAPITMTQRWLIPRIETFRMRHPEIDLHIRSIHSPPGNADIDIRYNRGSDETAGGTVFLVDETIPVCAPELLRNSPSVSTAGQLLTLPILLDTIDGWAWHSWCVAAGLTFRPAGRCISFDTDEAAIDACLSGLGVAQANAIFVQPMLDQERLVRVGPDVSAPVGRYSAVVRRGSRTADAFVDWLHSPLAS